MRLCRPEFPVVGKVSGSVWTRQPMRECALGGLPFAFFAKGGLLSLLFVGFHQERKAVVGLQDFALSCRLGFALPRSHGFDRFHQFGQH